MRINAFSDVSLRVVILLAAAPEGGLLTSQVISVGVGTPYHHVSKIITRLRELELVEVIRGRSGGVRISPTGRRATVGWLLRQLDNRADVADCETPAGSCPLIEGCGLRSALGRARHAFYAELDDVVISALPHHGPVGSAVASEPAEA
jgi:Rrf2 family nitric oxide-sensitive transcriptional repressor